MRCLLMFLLCLLLWGVPALYAAEEAVPEVVDASHWSCVELFDLAERYGVTGKIPEQLRKGGTATRRELAQSLLAIMEGALQTCEISGREVLELDDGERIVRLQAALQRELESFEGYLSRRDAIAKILAKPGEAPFLYKYGVAGFLRGAGSRHLSLSDNSVTPGHGEGQGIFRVKPYFYWHPTDWLDIHLEGQGYGFGGGNFQSTPVRGSRFDLYQAYLEARLPGSDLVAVRLGRQELVYGSAFVLGANTFNDGQVYDAATLMVKPWSALTLDIFGGNYVPRTADGKEGDVAGAYLNYAFTEGTGLDLYAVRDTGTTTHHSGEERNSWGARGTAKFGPFSFEIESLLQSGRLYNENIGGNEHIRAYGGHADIRYEFDLADFHNALFAAYAYGSGSQDAADGVSSRKEFDNPNNDSGLVESYTPAAGFNGADAGDIHASGIDFYVLGWGIDITKELNFTAAYRHFQGRHVPVGVSDEIGQETTATFNWNLNDTVALVLNLTRFYPGQLFADAGVGRKDVTTAYVMLQFDLSRTKPK